MKAVVLRDFSSIQLGNVSAGHVVELSEKHFAMLAQHGLVREQDPRNVVQVPEPAPSVSPATVVPEPVDIPMTDERADLIAKAGVLGIKIDARWSTKRLRKVVIG